MFVWNEQTSSKNKVQGKSKKVVKDDESVCLESFDLCCDPVCLRSHDDF